MSPSGAGLPSTLFLLGKGSQELSPISCPLLSFSNFLFPGRATEEDILPSFSVLAVSENMHTGLFHVRIILIKKEMDEITKATNKRKF